MHCIAEWVEDGETLAALKHIGTDYAQGHLLAMPTPLDDLLRTIDAGSLVLPGEVLDILHDREPANVAAQPAARRRVSALPQ
jgi:hypothetical protein